MQKATGIRRTRRIFERAGLSLAISALLFSPLAMGAPQGGAVTSGAATIGQAGNVTNINQSTQKATINWQGFGIGAGETVNFKQPDASSITLNRVIGNERSVIEGAMNANGKVFLINSNGVLFTKGSSVNTAGFVASMLDISDKDFEAGNYVFKGNGGTGSVINLGTITAREGAYVALLGNTVSNQGVITATKGTVTLNSADRVTLNFNGDSLLNVTVDEGTLDALVENKGAIYVDGGRVIMTARAADDLLSAQVNNSGLVQARTIDDLKGNIEIFAHGGTATVGGTLDASAPTSGDGGFIETSGDRVKVADSAHVTTLASQGKTGSWLIDPNDFTIAATGGDMTGTAVSNALASNNVEIDTRTMGAAGGSGDINVNQAVSWNGSTVLALDAQRNININADISATGKNAGLVMNHGGDYNILTPATYSGAGSRAPADVKYASITLSGSDAGLAINGEAYTLIHSMADLESISGTGSYALGNNLDASGKTYEGAVLANLDGTFAGLGHTISNLEISAPAPFVGLIGMTTAGSLVRDIGMLDVDITAGVFGGALVGMNAGNISKAYSTGVVSGANSGGLVGGNNVFGPPASGVNTISDSFSDATVTSLGGGGLVGYAQYLDIYRSHASGDVTADGSPAGGLAGTANDTSVYDSYASGNVTGGTGNLDSGMGGLIGRASGSGPQTIKNSYAAGNVTGAYGVGGLIGTVATSSTFIIDNSYATGNVTGTQATETVENAGIGGLVGFASATTLPGGNPSSIIIQDSHATGNVGYTGEYGTGAGGLVGYMAGDSLIDNSYATGNVNGDTFVGGLIGFGGATNISNSYATGNAAGNSTVGGLAGGANGAITNSHADGDVAGNNNIGGLVGSNGGEIIGSYATGTVEGLLGTSETGGLVGVNTGSIANSYASGLVIGSSASTGGLVGMNFNNSGDANCSTCGSVSNSYYNSEINSGLGLAGESPPGDLEPGGVTGGGGLSNAQFADVDFYIDGTIGAVIAARTAAAEQRAQIADAGLRSASLVNAQQQAEANTPPAFSVASPPPSMDSRIVYARSGGYAADINSITVDGVKFDLQDDETGKAQPATGDTGK